MSDKGKLHRKSPTFGKLMAALMHDATITDGACRLYAHMHWRYGSNECNFEGQKSMAQYLDVTPVTISARVRELEAKGWVVVVERDFNTKTGNFQTPFYHVFEDPADSIEFRKTYVPDEDEVIRAPTEGRERKNRKGAGRTGGNPKLNDHTNSSLDGDHVNSSLDGAPNSSLDGAPNSSLDYLDSSDPDTDYPDSILSPSGAAFESVLDFTDVEMHWNKKEKVWAFEQFEYIGRANRSKGLPASKWANPYQISTSVPRETALAKYRLHVLTSPDLIAAIPELIGKSKICWCAPEACHGHVLDELIAAHLDGTLPAMVEIAVKTQRNRDPVIEAVASYIFAIPDPTKLNGNASIIGGFEKEIYERFTQQFGLYNCEIAVRSVQRYVEWMRKSEKRSLPRYVSGFAPDYIKFLQVKDADIRAALEAAGTPATTAPVSAQQYQQKQAAKAQTLEEALQGLRPYSPMWKKAKAEWEQAHQ